MRMDRVALLATLAALGALAGCGQARPAQGNPPALGHSEDFAPPTVHAPAFFAWKSGAAGALDCASCHGQTFDGGVGPSCNACHTTTAGWTGDWRTNCSFCHGTATKAGFDPSASPQLAAPPDDVQGRLTGTNTQSKVGAHQAHLVAGAFAGPLPCSSCHAVPPPTFPDSLDHVNGTVEVVFSGIATSGGASATYASGNCTNYCHTRGGATPSPAWTGSALLCGSCHAPAPHAAWQDVTTCATCHSGTMLPDGTLDIAAGEHVNGTVDAFSHPTGYADPASPTFHGRDAVHFLQQVPSATDCAQCHGTDLNGLPPAVTCNGCHQDTSTTRFPNGVASWQNNCTFCHGTPTEPFDEATQLTLAAPPDDVQGRLTGTNTPALTGAHQAHLVAAANSIASPLACATCHQVPQQASSLDHLLGGLVQVNDPLDGTGQASLPANLGSFTAGTGGATGTCAVYCHGGAAGGPTGGSTSTPAWSGTLLSGGTYVCNGCHGNSLASPPKPYYPNTGQHNFHVRSVNLTCANCHFATVSDVANNLTPTIIDLTKHVNGVADVLFGGNFGGTVSGTFTPGAPPTCSTVSCHSDAGTRTW